MKQRKARDNKNFSVGKSAGEGGFTLVEIAIAMVIIGLLLAALLKSQEMISNARVKATIAQYKDIQASYYTFQTVYNALPGDMTNATTRLSNCTAATFCLNGDGNGMVGLNNAVSGTGPDPNAPENTQFWKHLAMANMITGVNPQANPAAMAFGQTHPRAAVGGGWSAGMVPPVPVPAAGPGDKDYGGQGVILMITLVPNSIRDATLVMTANEAEMIDRLVDDGKPNSGKVTGEFANLSGCDIDATNNYQLNRNARQCILFFELGGN